MYKPQVGGTISKISTTLTTNKFHSCDITWNHIFVELKHTISMPSLTTTVTLASSNVDIYPKDTLTAPVGFPFNIS